MVSAGVRYFSPRSVLLPLIKKDRIQSVHPPLSYKKHLKNMDIAVTAFQVSWSKALDPKHHRVPPRLRSLAALSMKPALYSTYILISLFASRLSYRFTLSHRSTSKPDSVQL
ncbi:hypothetical protein TcWFU_000107 [Taenia crassiceps]|uniref:Uncharacterized protein n=1 Tax=Taenia crassiceps TaxID=6207 RepID=A0ABR4QJ14_9CEST